MKTQFLIWAIIIAAIILIFVLLFAGCQRGVFDWNPFERMESADAKETVTEVVKTKAIIEKIYETNWLITVFILVGVLGVVAAIRGRLEGLGITAACVGGWVWVRIDQAMASNQWLWLGLIGLGLVAFGLFMYRDWIGKQAFKRSQNGGKLNKAMKKLVNKAKGK